MSTEPASQRAKSLTREAFARFLEWLSPDHVVASTRYLEIREKLVKLFVRKGCAHAEELADRTLDRVAAIVYEQADKYPNHIALCCGVARRVWLEYLREPAPSVLEDENIPAPPHLAVGFDECEEKCLSSCLDQLSQDDRNLVIQYHHFKGRQKIEMRKHLAEERGGLNKLRITTYRIRVRLRDCIDGCVKRSAPN